MKGNGMKTAQNKRTCKLALKARLQVLFRFRFGRGDKT